VIIMNLIVEIRAHDLMQCLGIWIWW